jgi:hypothetical protein
MGHRSGCWRQKPGQSQLLAIALALLVAGVALSPGGAHGAQPAPSPRVLRIPFASRAELWNLAARLDVWEVHWDAGYVVALAPPVEQAALAAEGYTASLDPRTFHPATIPDYPCYRTIAELYAGLQAIRADHPAITELVDIGDSFQGRDLWVLRITNQAVTAPKPALFVMANVHGRELITNETALAFVDYLTDGYGTDADVTWLVDHHAIHVLVSANPDGHVKNEPGEPWAWWRKNVNSGFCTGGWEGVDLNRNSSFQWGCCGGSSDAPCAETFRGPSAASESETQAVEGYVRTLFPDQRGVPLDAAAPLTATGVFITLHSYGNLLLWPWGHVYTPAPNETGLRALGEKMATYNGYTAQQSSALYPTDGATDDWVYGELGVAAYTFEIGSGADGFYPPCERYGALVQPTLAALLYAAKVARTPYLTAHGPDALAVTFSPTVVFSDTASVTVTATIDDANNGGDAIAAAECYLDAPPWAGGAPIPMAAADGTFDEVGEPVVAALDAAGFSVGRHVLLVRGQDAQGYWGPFSAVFLTVFANRVYLPAVMR